MLWKEAAHLNIQEVFGQTLHDSSCAQQDFAFGQKADGLGHFAETLLGQVRRVSQDDIKALRVDVTGQGQRFAIVIEDKLVSIGGESAVIFQHNYGDTI